MAKFNTTTQTGTTLPTDETELYKVKNFLTSKYVTKSWFSDAAAASQVRCCLRLPGVARH